jgi:hypothetical protein
VTTDEVILAKLDRLLHFQLRANAPWIGSEWDWTDNQADTDIAFSDDDYGALITTLVLGSAGPLRLFDVTYTLGFAAGGGNLVNATFGDVVAALAKHGFHDGVGYNLRNCTAGATSIEVPGRVRLAVLPYPLVRALTIFRVDMTWESTVTEEKASKEIHLTPRLDPPLPGRRGTPPVRTKTEVIRSRPSPDARA